MTDLRDDALAIVASCRVMTLATTGPEGPWAAPVFYAPDGFDLVFVSSPRSRHATDLAADPRSAVALHPEPSGWREIRGIQMGGRVEELHGSRRAAATARYIGRFPFVDPRGASETVRTALAGVTWYRFRPDEVHIVDNRTGFGRRSVPLA